MAARGQVTFVNRLILANKLSAPIAQNALVLADVDNDLEPELILGSNGGDLAVFKHDRTNPFRVAKGLGPVSALAVGKLRNAPLNSLVVINGEGTCHIFDIKELPKRAEPLSTDQSDEAATRAKSLFRKSSGGPLLRSPAESDLNELTQSSSPAIPIPIPSAKLPPLEEPVEDPKGSSKGKDKDRDKDKLDSPKMKSKTASLSPAVSRKEILVSDGYLDEGNLDVAEDSDAAEFRRTLPSILKKAKRLSQSGNSSQAKTEASPESLRKADNVDERRKSRSLASSQKGKSSDQIDSNSRNEKKVRFQETNSTAWRVNEWPLQELKSTSTHQIIFNVFTAFIGDVDEDGVNELVVGTNNRQVFIYRLKFDEDGTESLEQKSAVFLNSKVSSLSLSKDTWGRPRILVGMKFAETYGVIDVKGNLTYQSLSDLYGDDPTLKNANGEPLEVKHMERPPVSPAGQVQSPYLTALSSLNGQVALQIDQKLIWKMDLGQPLFSAHAIDLRGIGFSDTLAVSSWNGHTFIIDPRQNCVHFPFEERVQAFVAGNYAVSPGQTKLCLIFVTFYDEIFVYFDINNSAVNQILSQETKSIITTESDNISRDLKSMSFAELLRLKEDLALRRKS